MACSCQGDGWAGAASVMLVLETSPETVLASSLSYKQSPEIVSQGSGFRLTSGSFTGQCSGGHAREAHKPAPDHTRRKGWNPRSDADGHRCRTTASGCRCRDRDHTNGRTPATRCTEPRPKQEDPFSFPSPSSSH